MPLPQKDNASPATLEPSVYLYHAVLGAFRAQGKTFASWCDANEINRENARAALHGLWRGPKASKALERIIDGADRETVVFLLKKRKAA